MDLTTSVGALRLSTPIIAASGTFGYGLEYDGLIDWSAVGGVAVKGLSREPSQGHAAPRMVETAAGVLNAIGLQNIGVEAFARDKLPFLRSIGSRVIANCFANQPEGYVEVVEFLDGCEGVDVIELNLSCPHKPEWGGVLAADPVATAEVVRNARQKTRLPLWAKLSPNVTDITPIAQAAEQAGADALTVGNTLKGLAIDVDRRRPALANGSGGLSGPAIKPVALFMVHQVAGAVNIPVIGAGGIVSGADVVEFLMAGAAAVQVGTASLYDPGAPARIAAETATELERLGARSVSEIVGAAAD